MMTQRSADVAAGVRPTQRSTDEGPETTAATQSVVHVAEGGGEQTASVVVATAAPVASLQPPSSLPVASGYRGKGIK